ncbi:unnamed protein product [Ambrosiozyma monospora]|uniref:Unnamed protein product n=1 Tax=Ambrosiozyma monospora TaxID=43982 RepID=A0A9W6T3G4_AMBMO|nr:unnamed protein product [Ambrosiozyma monospora]
MKNTEKSSLGVIVSDKTTGNVVHYVENPETKISDVFNGGIYLFNDQLFKRLGNAKISKITQAQNSSNFGSGHDDEDIISMETDILRNLPEFGNTYVYEYRGFWHAIKTPADALTANKLYLEKLLKAGLSSTNPSAVSSPISSTPLHHWTLCFYW